MYGYFDRLMILNGDPGPDAARFSLITCQHPSMEPGAKECFLELADAAKNWLAVDGLWFQAVESAYGMDAAVAMDCRVWEQFAAIEARRIRERLRLPDRGGLESLETAFRNRLLAHANEYEIRREEKALIVTAKTCRVQAARERKGMEPFGCRPVGLIEFAVFARTIDPRAVTECLSCPPDQAPGMKYCSWKITLDGEK